MVRRNPVRCCDINDQTNGIGNRHSAAGYGQLFELCRCNLAKQLSKLPRHGSANDVLPIGAKD
jgi:hypothetical protein